MMVEPAETPVNKPAPSIVAIEALLLSHVPPGLGSFNAIAEPWQTLAPPPMGAGDGFTKNGMVM